MLASAAALAEFPEQIRSLFKNKKYSESGIFSVGFYYMGEQKWTVVDDNLPIKEGKDPRYMSFGVKKPVNSRKSANGAWWLPILEKAYAKFSTTYSNMNGGSVL